MPHSTRRHNGLLVALALVFLATMAESASAHPPIRDSLYLRVEGTCPQKDEVQRELSPLLDRWKTKAEPEPGMPEARLIDQGESFLVSVAGDTRTLSDPARDCAERARAAAVIIALRLDLTDEDATSPPPMPPSEDPPRSERPPSPLSEFEISVGGRLQKSIDAADDPTFGPFLMARLRKNSLSAQLSMGIQSNATATAQGVDLRFLRLPLDAGIGWVHSEGKWLLEPLALIAFDYIRASAPELDEGDVQGRFELGPRLGFRISRVLGRFRIFGLVDVTWFPREYFIEVEPLGRISTTPHWWFGARLGLGLPFPLAKAEEISNFSN